MWGGNERNLFSVIIPRYVQFLREAHFGAQWPFVVIGRLRRVAETIGASPLEAVRGCKKMENVSPGQWSRLVGRLATPPEMMAKLR